MDDYLEREKGFEPSTLALARRCSTTELFPLSKGIKKRWDSTEMGRHCQGYQSKYLRSHSASSSPFS